MKCVNIVSFHMWNLFNNDKATLVIIHPTDKGDSHADITKVKPFQCQIPQVIWTKLNVIKCNEMKYGSSMAIK